MASSRSAQADERGVGCALRTVQYVIQRSASRKKIGHSSARKMQPEPPFRSSARARSAFQGAPPPPENQSHRRLWQFYLNPRAERRRVSERRLLKPSQILSCPSYFSFDSFLLFSFPPPSRFPLPTVPFSCLNSPNSEVFAQFLNKVIDLSIDHFFDI